MTTTRSRRPPRLVRYVSPFGSPAWMTRERAEAYRREDDRRYEAYAAAGCLGAEAQAFGPPRIEHTGDRR